MKTLVPVPVVALMSALTVFGQATFQNLDFESATVVTETPPNIIDAAAALPDWTVVNGTSPLSIILYNDYSAVSLWGAGQALDGNFSVGFNTGGSISQTSRVPADARTLLFIGTTPSITGRLLGLSISGQNLQYSPVSTGPGYVQWGVDISAFAGQTETLTFSGNGMLDDIQFSPSLIPEASSSWLLLLGIGVFVYFRRCGRPAGRCGLFFSGGRLF